MMQLLGKRLLSGSENLKWVICILGPDGMPENPKCVSDKRTTEIRREDLQPGSQHGSTHSTKLRIRVYNIVHDREQVLEFAPL
jgi:hypothetical protein